MDWDTHWRREARALWIGLTRKGVITADERDQRLQFLSRVNMLQDPIHRAIIRERLRYI